MTEVVSQSNHSVPSVPLTPESAGWYNIYGELCFGPKPKRIFISGHRGYTDRDSIRQAIIREADQAFPSPLVLIMCYCPTGVDKIALEIVEELKLTRKMTYWLHFGNRTGEYTKYYDAHYMIDMVMYDGKIDKALLFMSSNGKGISHMLKAVQEFKVPYTIIQERRAML